MNFIASGLMTIGVALLALLIATVNTCNMEHPKDDVKEYACVKGSIHHAIDIFYGE